MARGQSCSAGCRVCVLFCLDGRQRPLQQGRPGWCCGPESCAHEIFCRMLFAVPVLLICNGQRPKLLPRLRCVPTRLPSRLLHASDLSTLVTLVSQKQPLWRGVTQGGVALNFGDFGVSDVATVAGRYTRRGGPRLSVQGEPLVVFNSKVFSICDGLY